jgi:hypothetical protein
MSSSFNTQATSANSLSPPPSPRAETLSPQEAHGFTRRPPVDFGARLANARNLLPDEAPPAPPPRQTANTAITAGSSSVLPAAFSRFASETTSKPVPKYGGVKGSYVSPFDSGGKTPGNKKLPASSVTVEEFEAKYGSEARRAAGAGAAAGVEDNGSEGSSGSDRTIAPTQARRTISFGLMPPVQVRDKGKAPAGPVAQKRVAPVVPEGVSTLHYLFSCPSFNH